MSKIFQTIPLPFIQPSSIYNQSTVAFKKQVEILVNKNFTSSNYLNSNQLKQRIEQQLSKSELKTNKFNSKVENNIMKRRKKLNSCNRSKRQINHILKNNKTRPIILNKSMRHLIFLRLM